MTRGTKLLKYGLHAAVLLGVIWAGVKTLNGDEVQKALDNFNWWIAPLVCLLGLGSVLIKAWRFATLLKETKEIERSVAMKAYVAGQSMTLLPGGIAARSGLLEQVGVKVEESSPAVALSSITDQLAFILCGSIAAMWFEAARKPVLIFLGFLALIGLLLGIEATRSWLIKMVDVIMGKFNWHEKWRGFVNGMSKTIDAKVIAVGVGNALMSFALLVGALYLCMRGVGESLPFMILLLAYTVPTMVGRISAMPGGFGLTEVGMVGVLDRMPGVRLDQAAAAVLVFRVGTVLFTALVGGILYYTGWRKVTDQSTPVVST
ncbi:MAG TPA: lysylphosphatidylglycerol synthase transmembrane domain-containing protein [Fimbriimonas sp.]|nr:lysylphosphatidylglycerol synthase transmembrane domain-containing protein [Fimbriimonas sp.]